GSIADVIDKYQLHKALGSTALEGIPMLVAEGEESDGDEDFEEIRRLVPLKVARSMDRLNRTRMLSSTPQNQRTAVPELYSRKDFDLKNIQVFNGIVQDKDVVGLSSSEEDATYRKLQDKLTHHKDTIEVQLLQEISRRSSSFFSALSNLQQLERDTEVCVSKIDQLRKSLAQIKESNIKKGLQVIRMKQTKSDLSLLYGAVKLISQAKQCQPVIRVLLDQSDYIGALDLLEEAAAFLMGKQDLASLAVPEELSPGVLILRNQSIMPKKLDFHRVTSVAHLSSQLTAVSLNISSTMEGEFVAALTKDLSIHLDLIANTPYSTQNIPSKSLLGVASSSIRNILSETYSFPSIPAGTATTEEPKLPMPALSPQDEALKATLTPLVFGLIRMDRVVHALNAYKESLFKQLKTVSKQYYPKVAEQDPNLTKQELKKCEQEELAKQLRGMSFDLFYATLVKIIIFFLRCLQRATIVNEIIISIIREAEEAGLSVGITKMVPLGIDKSPTKTNVDDDDALDELAQLESEKLPVEEKATSLSQSRSSIDGKVSFDQILVDARTILFTATELTHTRVARLVAVRQDQNKQLNPKDFYRLFNVLWEFLLAGEQLCGKLCFGLKGSILAQAKAFVNYFHEEKSKQIALLLDNEQWIQADIPIDFQRMTEEFQ
ncbi:Vacuolar protein sorting-associated protein 54, partial [Kappamyces sp. JEL0680]